MLSASSSVEHGFSGCEGLTHDNEEGFLDVKTIGRSEEIDRVDIGKEFELHALLGRSSFANWIMTKCFEHELWPEERTTDTDGNDVFKTLSGEASKRASPYLGGEAGDSIKHIMNILDNVSAVDGE